jgi:hypothetical protein
MNVHINCILFALVRDEKFDTHESTMNMRLTYKSRAVAADAILMLIGDSICGVE